MKSFPWTTQTFSCFYSLGAPPLYRDETTALGLYTQQPHENRQRAHPAVPCCQRPCGDQKRGTCSCLQNWLCTSACHVLQKQPRKQDLLNTEILPFFIQIKSQDSVSFSSHLSIRLILLKQCTSVSCCCQDLFYYLYLLLFSWFSPLANQWPCSWPEQSCLHRSLLLEILKGCGSSRLHLGIEKEKIIIVLSVKSNVLKRKPQPLIKQTFIIMWHTWNKAHLGKKVTGIPCDVKMLSLKDILWGMPPKKCGQL